MFSLVLSFEINPSVFSKKKKVNRQVTDRKMYSQNTYLAKDFYPEFIKNSYKSATKKIDNPI